MRRSEGLRRGHSFSLINPLGLTTTYAYSYGKLVTTTDPLGRETHFSYDSVGRVIRTTDALGGEIAYSYDPDGNRIGTTDQRGNETLTSVDALNRVTSVTFPDAAVSERSYNAVGNLVRTTDPLGNETLFEYDAAGRQTARVAPEGERTEYEYDAVGNRTALVRAAGTGLEVRDEYYYDALGRLIEVTRAINTADEVTVTYGYDANGNLTSITNGRGYSWTFEYDAMNRLLAEIDPLDRTRDYAYDLAGQLVEKRDPKGQKIQYDYDDGGRVVEARYIRADDTTENIARMAYDAVGNMVEVTDTNVDISQEFDERNRITLIRHEHLDKTQRQGWDAAGNRTWMSVDEIENSTATYTWDSRNQLTQIDHDTMGTVTYTYNAAGQKITMVLPNDIDCDYTYNDDGRLANLDYRKPDTTQVFFEDLTYDARGDIIRRVDNDGTHDYQYDELDRLTRADDPDSAYEQFAYDEAGNRTSVTTSGGSADYTVDVADQLTQIDGPGASEVTTFAWTSNGEMASQLHSSATTPTTYAWTVNSGLLKVSYAATVTVTYTHLPAAWLGWQLASNSQSAVTSYTMWDPVSLNSTVLLESSLSPHRLVLSEGVDRLLATHDVSAGLTRVPLTDHVASILTVTTTNAVISDRLQYSSYGSILETTSPMDTLSAAYVGRPVPSNGHIDLRNRVYAPAQGSFMSRDPLSTSRSAYAYVDGNPISYIDPAGLSRQSHDFRFIDHGEVGTMLLTVAGPLGKAGKTLEQQDYIGSYMHTGDLAGGNGCSPRCWVVPGTAHYIVSARSWVVEAGMQGSSNVYVTQAGAGWVREHEAQHRADFRAAFYRHIKNGLEPAVNSYTGVRRALVYGKTLGECYWELYNRIDWAFFDSNYRRESARLSAALDQAKLTCYLRPDGIRECVPPR